MNTHKLPEHKQFACDQCDKKFISASSLKTHMICHQTERPFICERCGNTFKTQHILNRHTKTIHQKDKACEVCGKLFGTKEQLGNIQNDFSQNLYLDIDPMCQPMTKFCSPMRFPL